MSFSVSSSVFRQVGTDTSLAGMATALTAAFTTITVTGTSGSVTSITVNGVEILGATVAYTGSTLSTATNIKNQINAFGSPYGAFKLGNAGSTVTIQALTGGTGANGHVVVITTTMTITGGAALAGGGATGATVTSKGNFTEYDIGTNSLQQFGDLTISGSGVFEKLAWAGPAAHNVVDLQFWGTLTIGVNQPNVEDDQNRMVAVLEETERFTSSTAFGGDGAGSGSTRPSLWFGPGSVVNTYSRKLAIGGAIGTSATSTVNHYDTEISAIGGSYYYGSGTGQRSRFQALWNFVSATYTLDGFDILSTAYVSASSQSPVTTINISNVGPLRSGEYLINTGWTSYNASQAYDFYNNLLGTDYTYGLVAGRYYAGTHYRVVSPLITDSSGTPIQNALVWIRGKSAMTPVTINTDAAGTGTANVALGTYAANNAVLTTTFNSVNNDITDLFDEYVCSYLHQIGIVPRQSYKGNGTLSLPWTLFADSLITQTTKATAAAYTTQETAAKAYDQLKSILYDNYDGESETYVTRSGTTLDCHALDVVVNGTGSGPATIVGNTLTLNALSFDGRIVTTGTITFTNGASATLGYSDSTGSTDTLIVPHLTSSFIAIEDTSGAQVEYEASYTGTLSYQIPPGETGDYHIHIRRQGYAPLNYIVTLNGTIHTLDGALTQRTDLDGNPVYSGTSTALITVEPNDPAADEVRIDVGNGPVTVQQAYDMVEDALVTSALIGSPLDQTLLPTALGFTFHKMSSGMEYRRRLATDAGAQVNGIVSQEDGTPVDETNGGVRIVGANERLSQQELRDSQLLAPSVGETPAAGSIDQLLAALQTLSNQIKTKTDNLPADPADNSEILAAIGSGGITLAEIEGSTVLAKEATVASKASQASVTALGSPLQASSYVAPANSDISAIKAKTDNLPSDPADQSAVEAAIAGIPAGLTPTQAATLDQIASDVAALPSDPASQATILAAIDGIPDAPSAAQNADAVRTELTDELTKIGGIDTRTKYARHADATLLGTPSTVGTGNQFEVRDPETNAVLVSGDVDALGVRSNVVIA